MIHDNNLDYYPDDPAYDRDFDFNEDQACRTLDRYKLQQEKFAAEEGWGED